MEIKFCDKANLPDYLEEALAPLYWSGIFSQKFRDDISRIIFSDKKKKMVKMFLPSITALEFLSKEFRDKLSAALIRFSEEE
jgi:hypothetical protein